MSHSTLKLAAFLLARDAIDANGLEDVREDFLARYTEYVCEAKDQNDVKTAIIHARQIEALLK